MSNLKAKTNLEKLGFSDDDKNSSGHDAIQIWVYQNLKTVLAVLPFDNEINHTHTTCKWEYPIQHASGNYKAIIGYSDLYVTAELYNSDLWRVLIEVKTKIPVLGELIRQLTTYKTYLPFHPIIVVSPDDRYASILREQGFYFFKYEQPC